MKINKTKTEFLCVIYFITDILLLSSSYGPVLRVRSLTFIVITGERGGSDQVTSTYFIPGSTAHLYPAICHITIFVTSTHYTPVCIPLLLGARTSWLHYSCNNFPNESLANI